MAGDDGDRIADTDRRATVKVMIWIELLSKIGIFVEAAESLIQLLISDDDRRVRIAGDKAPIPGPIILIMKPPVLGTTELGESRVITPDSYEKTPTKLDLASATENNIWEKKAAPSDFGNLTYKELQLFQKEISKEEHETKEADAKATEGVAEYIPK